MLTFFYTYANWHYTQGFMTLLTHGKHFLLFLWYFFSIPDLLKTLFAPWRRLQESYGDGYDLQEKFAAFTVNTIMRFIGMIVRLAVIAFGVILHIIAGKLLLLIFLFWLLLPAVVGVIMVVIVDTLL